MGHTKGTFQWVSLPDGTEVKVDVSQLLTQVASRMPGLVSFTTQRTLTDAGVTCIADALKRPLPDIHKAMVKEHGKVRADRALSTLKSTLREYGIVPEARR